MGLATLLLALIAFAIGFAICSTMTFGVLQADNKGSPANALVVSIFVGGIGGVILAIAAGTLVWNRYFEHF